MGKICIKDITASKTARLSRDTHKMKHTKLYKTTQHSAIYFCLLKMLTLYYFLSLKTFSTDFWHILFFCKL